jgi:Beta-galactosidase
MSAKWLALLGLTACAAAYAAEPDIYATCRTLDPGPATDGVVWARPMDGGPIRTLFIGPGYGLGDAEALAARLDLKVTIVPVWDSHELGIPPGLPGPLSGAASDETARQLVEALERPHDLIVIANVSMAALARDGILQRVFEQTRAGTGLLLAYHRHQAPKAFLALLDTLEEVEPAGLATWGAGQPYLVQWTQKAAFVRTSRLGSGRVVEFNYPGHRPRSHCLFPTLDAPVSAESEYFDSYVSFTAKAARWAAAREPAVRIIGLEEDLPEQASAEVVPPDIHAEMVAKTRAAMPPGNRRTYTLRLSAPAPRSYSVRSQMRQAGRDWQMSISSAESLHKGEDSYALYLSVGPGEYLADTWLMADDKVVDWHTQTVLIEGFPAIRGLRVSKQAILPNDTVDVLVDVDTGADSSGLAAMALAGLPEPTRKHLYVHARAIDSIGRVVAGVSEMVPPDESSVELTLSLSDLITSRLKVQVFAVETPTSMPTEQELHRAAYDFTWVSVLLPEEPEQFRFAAITDWTPEYNRRGLCRKLAELGVDSVYTRGGIDAALGASEAGLRPIMEVTSHLPNYVSPDGVRSPCLTDPVFQREEMAGLRAAAEALRLCGVSSYSLGRANCLTEGRENVCQSQSTLTAYRAHLARAYGTLDAMNAAWGTQFKTWDAIAPAPEQTAAELGTYAPWLDFRLFMDSVFADAHAGARTALREVDTRAQVGMIARPRVSVYQGYDWARLVPALDVLAVPPEPIPVEKVRAYRADRAQTAIHIDAVSAARKASWGRWYPWYGALHGAGGIWWEEPLGGTQWVPASTGVTPDGSPLPHFAALAQEVRALKGGLATIIRRAARKHPGIAVYDSRASLYMNHIDGTFASTSLQSEQTFARVLESLGYQYDLVSPAQLRDGMLDGYGVLVLPMVRAMANDEVGLIREFRKRGGSVIADVAPAQYTQHGTPRPRLPLDDLFGVEHSGPVRPLDCGDALVQLRAPDGRMVAADLRGIVADAGVQAAGATVSGVAGKTPVWLVYPRGGTLAALLNHPMRHAYERDPAALSLFDALLREAGARRIARPRVDGTELFAGEVVEFTYGEFGLLALIAAPDAEGKTQNVTVELPGERTSYDVRQGKMLHKPSRARASLAPGETALFASLPYRVTSLDLEAPETAIPGQRLPVSVRIRAGGRTPGEHVVRVDLVAPGGDPLRRYSRIVVCEDGMGETYIPLALNELWLNRPDGGEIRHEYQIVATDLLTGMSDRHSVQIEGFLSRTRRSTLRKWLPW